MINLLELTQISFFSLTRLSNSGNCVLPREVGLTAESRFRYTVVLSGLFTSPVMFRPASVTGVSAPAAGVTSAVLYLSDLRVIWFVRMYFVCAHFPVWSEITFKPKGSISKGLL